MTTSAVAPAHRLRAPASALAELAEKPAPTGMPWNSAVPRLITPRTRNSRFGSRASPCARASVRMLPQDSATMSTVSPNASSAAWAQAANVRSGRASRRAGRSMAPTSATPSDCRSNTFAARTARTITTMDAGIWRHRRRTTISAPESTVTATVGACQADGCVTTCTTIRHGLVAGTAASPSASGSCFTTIVIASANAKLRSTGRDTYAESRPWRPAASRTRMTPAIPEIATTASAYVGPGSARARRHQRGRRGRRRDDRESTAAEQRVGQQSDQRGRQGVRDRQPSQPGIGHGLGDQESGDAQPGADIEPGDVRAAPARDGFRQSRPSTRRWDKRTAVVGGIERFGVPQHLRCTRHGSAEQLLPPLGAMAEIDQLVRRRRSLASGTAQLCPGHHPREGLHGLLERAAALRRRVQGHAVLGGLQGAQDEGVPAMRTGRRKPATPPACALDRDDAMRFGRPVRLSKRDLRGQHGGHRLLQVQQIVAVGRALAAHEDHVAVDAETAGACNAARHVEHLVEVRLGLGRRVARP